MTARLRVLVVDDEPLARSGIASLARRDNDIEIVGECGDGKSAVQAIQSLKPDLVLLDIQMPEMTGFDVLNAIGPEHMPAVIFVTAYDQFAVRAFEVNALGYLLKPFDDERFAAAIARAKRTVRESQVGALSEQLLGLLRSTGRANPAPPPLSPGGGSQPYMSRLVVKNGGKVLFVRTEEIDWIEAADYYVRLHIARKSHLLRETMSALEGQLDPARFFRVHRSAIVNLDRVVEIQPYFHGEHILLLQDGSKLKLSRARKEKLEQVLKQSI
ncbi:MAG: LytTR family DNA-binding domain-containing protein [Gemmatimonadota bacterium]